MPDPRQIEAAVKLTVVAAESAAPKLLAAAESVAPGVVASAKQLIPRIAEVADEICPKVNCIAPVQEASALAATRLKRADVFERIKVVSVEKHNRGVDALLSNGEAVWYENRFGPGVFSEFRCPDDTFRTITKARFDRLKVGDVVARGYPIDGVKDWTNLNSRFSKFPVRVLKGEKDITVENLCYLGKDDFRLTLSNGRDFFRKDFTGGYLAKEKFAQVTPWNELRLPKAWQLKRGETVGREYPFQWVNRDQYLTNGEFAFPRVRPSGGEWHKYPISAVPVRHWQGYLDGLEGKFVREMIPLQKAITEPAPNLAAAVRELTPHQKALNSFLKERKMWDGANSEQVSLAQDGSVIFKVDNPGASPLYVVDKPGEFAIYVYREYKDAQALASGQARRAVEMLKTPRVIHIGEVWQDNLAALLQRMRAGEI